jgi:hypothetical protein
MEYQSPPIATPVGLDVRILVQAGIAIAMGFLMSVAVAATTPRTYG